MTTSTAARLLDDLNLRYERHASLADLTWYRVGGSAGILAHPANPQKLSALSRRCVESQTPVYVLGSGANLVVADAGVPGVVVKLDAPYFKHIKITGHLVTVGAGFDLAKLVLQTAKAGLAGLEGLAGIPATVGGAIRMNAGGAFGEIGHTVQSVTVAEANGTTRMMGRQTLRFGYRTTNITSPYILEVDFALTPDDPQSLIKRVKEIFRFKKATQPLAEHSAGCAFKNPSGTAQGGSPNCSAGQLIDQAGLKGYRVGGAEVSHRHANFIITYPGCTTNNILAVLNHVQQTVHERVGVLLQREIIVWP